jgi:hypothetical protein
LPRRITAFKYGRFRYSGLISKSRSCRGAGAWPVPWFFPVYGGLTKTHTKETLKTKCCAACGKACRIECFFRRIERFRGLKRGTAAALSPRHMRFFIAGSAACGLPFPGEAWRGRLFFRSRRGIDKFHKPYALSGTYCQRLGPHRYMRCSSLRQYPCAEFVRVR